MNLETLYIDRPIIDFPETEKIRRHVNADEIVVDGPQPVFDAVNDAPDPVKKGKQTLFLTENKGPFVRPCPGTRRYRCCGYQILNVARFCTLDCSYCIMQAYFHPPVLQYYVNREDMTAELHALFQNTPKIMRIGTGEFTDSAIWEDCTDLNEFLIETFAGQDKTVLELKTKTTNIESLKKSVHNRKTIAAWSLNTEAVAASEERGAPPAAERLRAAAECQALGYPLAFHFDPMVIYEGCEEDYRRLVDRLFAAVSPENIVWISLGSFRFMPDLKPVIEHRFPTSTIVYGEFITGADQKMRYFKPLRIRLYQAIIQRIREIAPAVTIYFCMEDDRVWKACLGFAPAEKGGIPRILDQSAAEHCGLDKKLCG